MRGVALLSLLRMAADLLLPEGKAHRLCDTLLGLMVMLCMLRELQRLLLGWSA